MPAIVSPLIPFLLPKLPDLETVEDASIDVLALLRILNGLNRHWATLYYSVRQSHIIAQSEFIHSKVKFTFNNFVKFTAIKRHKIVFRLQQKLVVNYKTHWLL